MVCCNVNYCYLPIVSEQEQVLRTFSLISRKTVKNGSLSHPFAITVYKDRLYWTDWKNKSIFACKKNDCKSISKIQGNLYAPMDIHVFESDRQGECLLQVD